MTDTEQQEIEAAWAEVFKRDSKEPAAPAANSEDTAGTGQAAETQQDDAAPGPLSTAPETTSTDDLWADAPEHLRSAYMAEKERADRAEHQRRSDEGRVSGYQRKADELQRKVGLLASVGKQEDLKAYFDTEGYKKAKSDYGDDLGPIFTLIEGLARNTDAAHQQIGQFGTVQAQAVTTEINGWLDENAGDRGEIFGSDSFIPWLNTQPRFVRDLAQRNWKNVVDPAEIAEICDRFRGRAYAPAQTAAAEDASQPSDTDRKRNLQLDGSKSHSSKAPILTRPDENDEDAAWDEAMAAIRKRAAAR
jgi:hypothetical protein